MREIAAGLGIGPESTDTDIRREAVIMASEMRAGRVLISEIVRILTRARDSLREDGR